MGGKRRLILMNEFEYRKSLGSKKESLTLEERTWLATHSHYHEVYGYPILRSDCIEILAKKQYRIIVTLNEYNTPLKITPTITVPLGQGYVMSNATVYNAEHQIVSRNKKIVMLSTCNNLANPVSELQYYSDLGVVDVSFHCELKDHRGTPFMGSSKVIYPLGMKKEYVSESKVIYRCNDMDHQSFDCYAFSVEWDLG
jgi:hypothetical protein